MADDIAHHEVVSETDVYRIIWLNPEKSIIVFEIKMQWRLEDALVGVRLLNDTVMQAEHPVYTIYHYKIKGISFFPRGVGLSSLRRLVEIDPPNEQLVIFIRADGLIRNLIRVISKSYGLRHIFQKYHYVETWAEAISTIEKHQQA